MLKYNKTSNFKLDKIIGWFNFDNYYQQIYNSLPNNSKIFEIGVFYGKSTCFMANLIKNNNKNVEFHCCDTFIVKDKIYVGVDGLKLNENFKKTFQKNLSLFGLSQYVIVHEGKSANVLSRFPNDYFDFIFIDGDHKFSGVIKDISIGFEKLKCGGILAGHDAHVNDIVRALKELNLSYKFIGKWKENPNLNLLWEVCKK